MTHATCARAWEVEAAHDGQLDDVALATLQRHTAECATCREAQVYFESLGPALSGVGQPVDEVAVRRTRQALLERAARLAHESHEPKSRAPMFAAAAACALVAGTFAWSSRTPKLEKKHDFVAIAANDAGSKWSRHHTQNVEHIVLGEGDFHLRVQRAPGDPRLFVQVPDGEIEDLGTVFSVSVRGRETRMIAVNEGVVVFRRGREPALRLSAGMSWRPSVSAATSAKAVVAPSRGAAALAPSAAAPANASVAKTMEKHVVTVHGQAQSHRSDAGVSSHDEDAAYLQLLALLHENRQAEARLAAVAYLRAYPNAFRRVEVQRIAQSR